MRHAGAHSSILSRNGSHISTQAASMRLRCPLLSCVLKYSSSVSFFRSRPNHSGSPVSRLLTTVTNFCCLPRWISSTPICRSAGFRRAAVQRSKYRRSMARTVLSARENLRATCRADALSHACPTISSNRLLNGALLGNCSTRSVLIPHSGHRIRYSSITTVVRNSKHARSRTSRSYTSWISLTRCPHPEHISLRFPDFRRTHSFKALARSSTSCWYTRYPGHPRIFVHSLFLKLSSVVQKTPGLKAPSIAYFVTFLLRAENQY